MAKGSQNKDSKVAYDHAIKSIGKYRKCNGIFHKGYSTGEAVNAEFFKRMGKGYQAFCSDCDQARQNIQKTVKRIAAIVMADPAYRIALPKEFEFQENIINNKLERIISECNSAPLLVYTRLVSGKEKFTIKELGLYKTDLTIKQKAKFIELINGQVRGGKNDELVKGMLKKIGKNYKFKCSTCGNFYLVSEVQPNISQSRDIFDLNNKPTDYKLPLHNVCSGCMQGNRSESLRHFKYLCNGDFVGAARKMTKIGKKYLDRNIHADHIIPLRLGGKHDPKNIRAFVGKENIKKRDKLTREVIEFIKEKSLPFEELLTDWYVPPYKKFKNRPTKIIEVVLRNAVDEKRKKIMALSHKEKTKILMELYPTLNSKEVERIIRKCFSPR